MPNQDSMPPDFYGNENLAESLMALQSFDRGGSEGGGYDYDAYHAYTDENNLPRFTYTHGPEYLFEGPYPEQNYHRLGQPEIQDLLKTIVGDSSVGMYGSNPQHMRSQKTAASQSWQDYMNNWLGKNTVGGKGLPRINRRNVAGQGYSDQFSNPYSEDTYTPGSDVLTNYGAYDYGETLGDVMHRQPPQPPQNLYPTSQNPQP